MSSSKVLKPRGVAKLDDDEDEDPQSEDHVFLADLQQSLTSAWQYARMKDIGNIV